MNIQKLLNEAKSIIFIKCPRNNSYNYIQEFETEQTDICRWVISVQSQRKKINKNDIVFYLSSNDVVSAYKIKDITKESKYFRSYWDDTIPFQIWI